MSIDNVGWQMVSRAGAFSSGYLYLCELPAQEERAAARDRARGEGVATRAKRGEARRGEAEASCR